MNQDVGTPREGPRTEAGRFHRDLLVSYGWSSLSASTAVRLIETDALSEVETIVARLLQGADKPEQWGVQHEYAAGWVAALHSVQVDLALIASLRDKETAK